MKRLKPFEAPKSAYSRSAVAAAARALLPGVRVEDAGRCWRVRLPAGLRADFAAETLAAECRRLLRRRESDG